MKKPTVKIINPVQAGFYYKNGLKPLEIVFTDRWVWVFDKESSNPLYTRWLNNEKSNDKLIEEDLLNEAD